LKRLIRVPFGILFYKKEKSILYFYILVERKNVMILKKVKRIKFYIILCSVVAMLSVVTIRGSNHNVSMNFIRNWEAVAGNNGVYGPLPMITIDGKVAWCLQADKVLETGENVQIDFKDIGITNEQQQVLSLIANFGYYSQPSEDHYALVQNVIWEYLGDSDFYVSEKYPTRESQQAFKEEVMDKVRNYQQLASFHNTVHSINVGEMLTFDDTNGVLQNMEIASSDGLDAKIEGNRLLVIGTINAKDNARITLKKSVKNEGTNFVVRKGNSQAVSVLTTKDIAYSWIDFEVQKYIDVTLSKIDADTGSFISQGDASLVGAEYSLYTNDNKLLGTKVVDDTGKICFEKLWVGQTYYIKETKAPLGYVLSE
jgi:hypothetical protein